MRNGRRSVVNCCATMLALTVLGLLTTPANGQGVVYYGPPTYTYYYAPTYYAPAPVYVSPAPAIVYYPPVYVEPAPVVTYYETPATVWVRPRGRTKWEYKVRTPYGTHEYEYKYDRHRGLVTMRYDFDD